MDEKTQRRRKKFLVNIAYWVVVIAMIYCILKYLIRLVMPFVLAVIIASIARPLSALLSDDTRIVTEKSGRVREIPMKVRMNKKIATIAGVIIIFIIIFALLVLICVNIVNRGEAVVESIPTVYTETLLPGLENMFSRIEDWAARIDNSVLEVVEQSSSDILSTIGSKVTEATGKILVWISSIASGIPNTFLNIVICLIASVFIALDYDAIAAFIRNNLPEKTLEYTTDVRDTFVNIVKEFIKSYFVIFIITAAEITIGFCIVGQSNPLFLGVLIAVFDAFPIVGSGMILLPLAIITLISGKIGKGIGLLIVYLTVVIVRQVIEPKIVGKHVGLRPIVTLVCMYVGLKLFGGIGLLALPIIAAIISDMNSSGTVRFFKTNGSLSEEEL